MEDRPIGTERILYIRDDRGQPIGCLAYQSNRETDSLSYAISVLHPNDRFDRSLARRIALGRLRTGNATRLSTSNVRAIMQNVADRQDVPSRIRKAVRRRLTA